MSDQMSLLFGRSMIDLAICIQVGFSDYGSDARKMREVSQSADDVGELNWILEHMVSGDIEVLPTQDGQWMARCDDESVIRLGYRSANYPGGEATIWLPWEVPAPMPPIGTPATQGDVVVGKLVGTMGKSGGKCSIMLRVDADIFRWGEQVHFGWKEVKSEEAA